MYRVACIAEFTLHWVFEHLNYSILRDGVINMHFLIISILHLVVSRGLVLVKLDILSSLLLQSRKWAASESNAAAVTEQICSLWRPSCTISPGAVVLRYEY